MRKGGKKEGRWTRRVGGGSKCVRTLYRKREECSEEYRWRRKKRTQNMTR